MGTGRNEGGRPQEKLNLPSNVSVSLCNVVEPQLLMFRWFKVYTSQKNENHTVHLMYTCTCRYQRSQKLIKRTLAMKMQIITIYTHSLSCNKMVKTELNRLVPFYARDDFVDKNIIISFQFPNGFQ